MPQRKTLATLLRSLTGRRSKPTFDNSSAYWEARYRAGGNSGAGSYNRLADFKAEFINGFIERESIRSVIEFGCGDGNQLALLKVPDYVGVDVSRTVLERCRALFAGDERKRFLHVDEPTPQAELALSLDVIFHLVEDEVYERYINDLFAAATRYVIIYSSNDADTEVNSSVHVRHRCFTDTVEVLAPAWQLVEHVPNRYPDTGDHRTGSAADFFVFTREATPPAS